MYFTVDTWKAGSHVWRQRFPDGAPQQLTPSGASEEEGLAIMPDGKSFITTAGTQQSAIWLHDGNAGEKQISSEGSSFFPTLSPDGKKIYSLRRVLASHSPFSGGSGRFQLPPTTQKHPLPPFWLSPSPPLPHLKNT